MFITLTVKDMEKCRDAWNGKYFYGPIKLRRDSIQGYSANKIYWTGGVITVKESLEEIIAALAVVPND
jgi:hypothetical protein